MTSAELKTLRESLGLPVAWLAAQAGVKERTVNYWESGRNTVPDDVAALLETLAGQADNAVKQALAAHENARVDGATAARVVFVRYRTNADLWRYRKDMASLKLPTSFHAVLYQRIMQRLEERGVEVTMIYFHPEAYELWRTQQGVLADSEATRALWATAYRARLSAEWARARA